MLTRILDKRSSLTLFDKNRKLKAIKNKYLYIKSV